MASKKRNAQGFSRGRKRAPKATPLGGYTGKAKDATRESRRAKKSFQVSPPLLRVSRAPGEVNPRKGKRGGLNRSGKMIE